MKKTSERLTGIDAWKDERLTGIDAWKDEKGGKEWARVLQMRQDKHPLILGGQNVMVTDAERRLYGIPNRRIV